MSSVEEHAAVVASLLGPALTARAETVALDDALGRVTSTATLSPVDLPLFRNSQMDGFAVVAADLGDSPTQLLIVGTVPAMALNPRPIERGMAASIMTGAVLPEGADTVIPVEDTTVEGETVVIHRARRLGEYVRDRGSDVRTGDELLPAGLRLASRHLAVLAAAGITGVRARVLPRVAIITTGTEIVQPGITPVLGQVFDSNATALVAAVRTAGGQVAFRAHVGDDTRALLRALRDAAAAADLILTSGGISMGDYEVVRETLEPLGAHVGHVAMQPGGPQVTAVFEGVPVICFPGNPVSTQVSFEVFVAPLLRHAAGLPAAVREPRVLAEGLRSMPGKRQFLRGRAMAGGRVALVAGPGSHLVAGLAASDLLVIVPEEVTALAEGRLRGNIGLMSELSHLDADGRARMVDVGDKAVTKRTATATGRFTSTPQVIGLVKADGLPKADVLATARIAGIAGAKKTSELIPLCHQLALTSVTVDFVLHGDSIEITATAKTTGQTGVEMEALTAVAIAGLTLHDMTKAVDPHSVLTDIRLVSKIGGKTRTPTRPGTAAVIVASTAGAAGTRKDTTGPVISAWLIERGYTVELSIVADADVAAELTRVAATAPAVILTTGGTGMSPTDRTPEATRALLDRELPGVSEAIRARGLPNTPKAALSRGLAGTAGETVIVNLPGSTGGVNDGLEVLDELLEHLVAQVAGGGAHE